MDLNQIKARLVKDEGTKPSVYQDSRGFWTIGNGFLVDAKVGGVLPEPVRDFWLTYLVNETIAELIDFPSLSNIDETRKQLLVCLLYNMGEQHLKQFNNMLTRLMMNDYNGAADELKNSLWYSQVGVRGPLYERIMRTGVWE